MEYTLIYVGFVGLFMGSFINVLADRLAREETLMGRSHCDSCKHSLGWQDLIPVISYLFLRRRCRYCKAVFSVQYILVEIVTAAIYIGTWTLSMALFADLQMHIIHLILVSILWAMFLADMRYQIIPDELQIALAVVSIFRIATIYHFTFFHQDMTVWWSYLYAVALTTAPIYGLYLITRGKGMGFGDVKFAANMGLLVGLWGGAMALYVGFVMGGIVGAIMLIAGKKKLKSKIAFGPFLILGTYASLFFEHELLLLFTSWLRIGL